MGKSSLQSGAFKYIVALCLLYPGSAIFIINPTNVTTCLGSPAVFTCVINESLPLLWLINGTPSPLSPATTFPTPGAQSTLSLTATSELIGASVQCYYLPPGSLTVVPSPPVYLSVQAPPSAPTNLSTTALNATSVVLAWGPPSGAQSPSLFYRVLATSGNGTLVYNKTLKELQLILTTPDPCDQYWANVTTVYVNLNSIVCTGSGIRKAITGDPPDSISIPDTSFQYSNSSHDNVTVKIILPSEPGICNYMIRAMVDDGTAEATLNKSHSASGGKINTTLRLLPLKHYNVFITAFNTYGMNFTQIAISTFSVINVTESTEGLQCAYNFGSPAIGCVMYIKNTTLDIPYCKVVMKYSHMPVNISLCNSSYANGFLSSGEYSVDAYDIGSDGCVSLIPAITRQPLYLSTTPQGNPTTTPSTPGSTSLLLGAIVGGAIGGVIGGVAVMLLLVVVVVIKKHLRVVTVRPSYDETHSPKNTANSEQSENNHYSETHSQNSVHSLKSNANSPSVQSEYSLLGNHEMDKTTMNTKEESHYRVIDFEAKRAIPPPPLDTTVTYATVQSHA